MLNRMKATLGITALALGSLALAAPAMAQTTGGNQGGQGQNCQGQTTQSSPNYQPGPCQSGQGNQNGGTHVQGETFTNNVCGFQPGASVNMSVDGQTGPTQTANGNGCVPVTIKVLDNSHVQVQGVTFNAACGPNSVILTGPNTAGSTVSQTDSFSISCAATPSTSSGKGLAFTGANVLKLGGAAGLLILVGFALVALERRKNRLQG